MLKELRIHKNFQSKFLPTARDIIVYLPPGYFEDHARRYPTLFLNDGQNLFDSKTSYIPGKYWRVGETANALIYSSKIEPMIIVGVYNAGLQRINEYTPTRDPRQRVGGHADLYGRMLVEELKPWIDTLYRTMPEREYTGLGGSSLGGLATIYLGFRYPHIFSRLAVISPSIWWDNRMILRYLRAYPVKPDLRIWLDMGTRESTFAINDARILRDLLLSKGWRIRTELRFREVRGGKHDELAWARRFDAVLKFLYPQRKTRAPRSSSIKKNLQISW